MEQQEQKNSKKKAIKKVVTAVIAVILMFAIAAVVATIIHRNMNTPVSGNVKNGLSAYELAVEQGYDGSVEDWLGSLKGKSAYEIAAENGYSGTEKDFSNALTAMADQNGAVIKSASFSSDGDLLFTLSDGTVINAGSVAGSDGKN